VSDYYVTPVGEIRKFLMAWEETSYYRDKRVLDPCAGGDAEHSMSYPTALSEFGYINISTLDIRDDSRALWHGDYLELPFPPQFDMIITNPPFSIAQEVATKAFSEVAPGGVVVMLLRLNFFGSQRRRDWWDTYRPDYVFIHSKRMSFTGHGTDSIEYMHCIWGNPRCVSHNVHLEVI